MDFYDMSERIKTMKLGQRAVALFIILSMLFILCVGVTSAFAAGSGVDGLFAFDNDDKNAQGLHLSSDVTRRNCELLCSETELGRRNTVRFVSLALSDILKNADDYGYMLYTVDTSPSISSPAELNKNLDEYLPDTPNAVYSCKNTVSRDFTDGYGNNVFENGKEGYTRYKYITLTVNNVPTDKYLVARFFVKLDGEYHYATYNSSYKACVYSANCYFQTLQPKVELIGHRGAMDMAPQDTLVAFQEAADIGYPSVEADFWVSESGDLLVLHDQFLWFCDAPTVDIKKVSAESRFKYPIRHGANPQNYETQYIPTVEELIEKVSSLDLTLYLHIKDADTSDAVFSRVIATLKRYNQFNKTVFVTSSKRCIQRLSGHGCRMCFLVPEPDAYSVDSAIDLCRKTKATRLMVRYFGGYPTDAQIKRAHSLGIKIGVYDAFLRFDISNLVKRDIDFLMLNKWK